MLDAIKCRIVIIVELVNCVESLHVDMFIWAYISSEECASRPMAGTLDLARIFADLDPGALEKLLSSVNERLQCA